MYLSLADFRKRIEFSLCQPYADHKTVVTFCERALSAGVGVVCVNPVYLPVTVKHLAGQGIEISGNVGFPFGTHTPEVKALETKRAIDSGATQIDMVTNIGALRSGENNLVYDDIQAVVAAASGAVVKTIIEAWVLTTEEKERACRIAEKAGAGVLKTSTGVRTQYLADLSPRAQGALVEDILLMRSVLSSAIRIKAAGGIYDLQYALTLIKAGADQLGMSQGESIIREFTATCGAGIDLT